MCLKTTKDSWEALVKLYQSDNQSRKMLLRQTLRSMEMAKGELVVMLPSLYTLANVSLSSAHLVCPWRHNA
jgi:hypothetical protein